MDVCLRVAYFNTKLKRFPMHTVRSALYAIEAHVLELVDGGSIDDALLVQIDGDVSPLVRELWRVEPMETRVEKFISAAMGSITGLTMIRSGTMRSIPIEREMRRARASWKSLEAMMEACLRHTDRCDRCA